METKNRHRLPALIAGAVVVSGVAVGVTAVAPSSPASTATAAAASKVTAAAPSPRPAAVNVVPAKNAPVSADRDARLCASKHGKYHGAVLRTFPVVGDMGASRGERGGTLTVMWSRVCRTAWVQVKKDARHDGRAYGTNAWIATYATAPTDHSKQAEDYREATTRAVLSTKAVPLLAHGRIEVEAGWAGNDFSFNTVHTILY
jgi:hypothetical protein